MSEQVYLKSGLTAAGTTQADALVLTQSYNQIGTCAAGAGVILPTGSSAGSVFTIRNDGANVCSVYPPVGGRINANPVNDSYSLSPGQTTNIIYSGGIQYYTVNPNNPNPLVDVLGIAVATTLTERDSGSIVSLTSAGANYTITLPEPTIGISFKFVVEASAGTNQIQITSTGANCVGFKTLAGTTTNEATARTNLFFGNSTGPVASTVGDKIEIYSNGTNYFWTGYGAVAASIRAT